MFEGTNGPGDVRNYPVPGSRMVTRGILGRPESPAFTPRPRNPRPVTRAVKDQVLQVQVEEVSKGRFAELGIDARYFRPGLRIYYLDQQGAAAFWESQELSPGVAALYIRKGRLVLMPPQTRDQGLLAHEVLHDVYRQALRPEERDHFNRSLAVWVSNVINRKGNPKVPRKGEDLFYRAVEVRLKERLKLSLTTEEVATIAGGVELKGPALSFASESFAYGGAMHLGYWSGPEFGVLPREMADFFQQMQLAA